MKTAEIIYLGELRNEATHLRSGTRLITDAPVDNNGKGQSFSPTDLLSVALGTCMITIMGIVADRNSLNISGTKVQITKIMKENPRRVGEIIVELTLPDNKLSQKEKTLLENAALTCPVAKSLSAELKQTVKFDYL